MQQRPVWFPYGSRIDEACLLAAARYVEMNRVMANLRGSKEKSPGSIELRLYMVFVGLRFSSSPFGDTQPVRQDQPPGVLECLVQEQERVGKQMREQALH